MKHFDIAVIGAGAVGNAIARELSEYSASVAVIEKEPDTCFGTSGRNSGVLHSGFNNRPGTLMAKFCVSGSQGFAAQAERLGIDFKRTGKKVVALDWEDEETIRELLEQGKKNGVRRLSIIEENRHGVLYSPETGVFDPFEYTIALAEQAVMNGAAYYFGAAVCGIRAGSDSGTGGAGAESETASGPAAGGYIITMNRAGGRGDFQLSADMVINSAGLYSDRICGMLGINDYEIHPCRGEYHILDQSVSDMLKIPVYPAPKKRAGGLGVHLTPTIHGNIMIGPSAEYIDERDDRATTAEIMEELFQEGRRLLPGIDERNIIRSFAGIRPKLAGRAKGGYDDFIIREYLPGFIALGGIESPGLTSSVPIAKYVTELAGRRLNMVKKEHLQDRSSQAAGEYDSSPMICRCESITEGRILKAFDDIGKIGAVPTMRGIKYRCRAGMGYCQGSFCTANIVELLVNERGVDPLDICQDSADSFMFTGRTR